MVLIPEELPFCECGCGNPVTKPGNRFIQGHTGGRTSKPKPEPKLCACECGGYAKSGNRFIFNHHLRGENNSQWKPKQPEPKPKLCACGCGELVKPGNRFISGHNIRGVIHAPLPAEWCKAISDGARKEKEPLPDDWEIDKNSKTVTNKDCANYLGCYITERVLTKLFKNVQRMPYGNSGFDFICGKGYKVDSKGSATGYKGLWQFGIRKNEIADYFIFLAFESREDLTPIHLWIIPGNVVNRFTTLTITKSTIHEWVEYEQPIDKTILCCNKMR